jgi:catechol 2,3-dioxygenase-like lactoylglutathione lyase family enzyme
LETKGEFRFAYFAAEYEKTIAFYRDGLGFPVAFSWDRSRDDRGTVFAAASGLIEVLARPMAESDHLFDARAPQGAFMVIETMNVDALHAPRNGKGVSRHRYACRPEMGSSKLLRRRAQWSYSVSVREADGTR